MTRLLGAALAIALVSNLAGAARADQKEADAALDKAIKALGGAEKLDKAEAMSWKSKATISFGDNKNEFEIKAIVKGLDHYKADISSDRFNGVVVLNGDKGWRKFGENGGELEGDALANEKRNIYLQVAAARPLILRGKGFKYESGGEEKVGGKPAVALKCTGPDGKTFTLLLDKESGLPVASKAKVAGFQGDEFDQETTYADYKDFDGIKKATKIEVKRNGETFMTQTVTDFKVLDKVSDDTFAEPK
jgi:hypothetical protein